MIKEAEQISALREELKAFGKNKSLSESISPIIFSNLQKGRVKHYLSSEQGATLRDYVLHVAKHYERWHGYVNAIQVERQEDLWKELLEKMQKWAYLYLQRRNYFNHKDINTRFQLANACASEAAVFLMNADFPYDVEFDAWLSVIVQNAVRKTIERDFPLNSYVQSEEVALDTLDDRLLSAGVQNESEPTRFELRNDLLQAIDQLSESQKQVIVGFYFYGKPLPKLAEEMDINVNAIYKRHFDALKQLRKILIEEDF